MSDESDDFRFRFNSNAEDFDGIMVDMLAEYDRVNKRIAKYEDAFNRIISDCTARKAILISKHALEP